MSMRLAQAAVAVAWIAVIGASRGTDCYVSPRGDDAAPGTIRRPWKSIDRVNRATFQAGDRVLFEGGKTFAGTILLDSRDRGRADRKVVLGSYGQGRATIDGGNSRALTVESCDHIQIRDLRFLGSGRKAGNTECGIFLSHAAGIEVDNVEVTGFRGAGINISGVHGVRITRTHVHENGFAGINSGGDLSQDLYVARCLAENNPGDPISSMLVRWSGHAQ